MNPLHLHLLGSPEVYLGDSLLTFPTRKSLALLIYLAVEANEQPRGRLATLLWPEADPKRSLASLRNTLGHLKSALRQTGDEAETAYLSITHTALALNPDADIHLDLQTVERAYTLARSDRSSRAAPEGAVSLPVLQAAAACQRGDFLAGFSLGDAPGFDDWADTQREVWRRRLGLILDRLSEIQFAQGELAGTAETASLWIALDALNEVAYRRKMRAHFAAGERGQALQTYDACRAILAAELSVTPEPDTEALAESIRAQHLRQHAAVQPRRHDTPVAFLENLFAGRTVEHQVLRECYGRAVTGQPQVAILHGEAGIGKTRLAREFLTWAIAQGAETLHGRAFESSGQMSYQPLIEACRPLLEREDMPPDWLEATWLAPLSQLFPELRARYPEVSPTHLKTAAGQTQLFEALVRLTLALAQRAPLALFIDDLQWADNATLDLLQYALQRWRETAARILLLVSLPSAALQPPAQLQRPSLIQWLAHLAHELALCEIKLEPLSEQDTVQMMLSILRPPVADFAEWVFKETRGQPFYMMETLKDLLERGALHPKRRAENDWAFEVDAEHNLGQAVRVPSTVQTVIRARLNRLSPNAFALLATGAVLEQQLTFERLCAIANFDTDIGLPALDELVSGRLLLEVTQPGSASAYLFAHQMIREVIYTEAGDARRRLFHQRALEVMEAERVSAAVLARHALAAGLAEAAFRHSLAAGQEALHLSAASEAILHFEKARQLAREASSAGATFEAPIRDLYRQLGRAYEVIGQPAQAKAVYEELKRLKPEQS